MKKYKLHILTVFFTLILLTLLSFGASAEDAPTEDYLTKPLIMLNIICMKQTEKR